ncbi:shikimate dehydrogenase [Microbacterium aoyamense]|uniref:shikimate dehydrogenase n=1 Tax=Microbacterium aoyamense TaxID=344166 RepID=UPI0027E396B7|nr:shikimate dehydrogenase [Microbacterium aoyamense]
MQGQPGRRVLTPARHRLAVWGDPIAHSRSPRLHGAAYGVLGLDWEYDRRQVSEARFDTALRGLDGSWRGLSLTFPLKGAAFRAAATLDRRAELTGAVNTLLLQDDGAHGFNTDIGGIVASLRDEGITAVVRARIVGAGATATSALVALAELGATWIEIAARRPEAVAPLVDLGASLGVAVAAASFDAPSFAPVDVTIATLPGDAPVADAAADALAQAGGFLLDVVYGHWPTALASAWERADAPSTWGLGMLLHQAVLQVRIFVSGQVEVPLDDEGAVLAAMRLAVVED